MKPPPFSKVASDNERASILERNADAMRFYLKATGQSDAVEWNGAVYKRGTPIEQAEAVKALCEMLSKAAGNG